MRRSLRLSLAVLLGLGLFTPLVATADHRYSLRGYSARRSATGGYRAYHGTGYFNHQYANRPRYVTPYYSRRVVPGYAPRYRRPGFSRGYVNPTVRYHYSAPRVTTGRGYRSFSTPHHHRGFRRGPTVRYFGRR